jgi:hypothetical protein
VELKKLQKKSSPKSFLWIDNENKTSYLIGCIILGGPGQFILAFAMEGIGPGLGLG